MDLAIVVAGYSRLDSVKRITSSILASSYSKDNITLYYSLDYSDNQDSIIKYIDYSLPNINGMYGISETKVRKIIAGESVGYFFQISKEGKYDTKNASIEYSDLLEVIKAIERLKQESEQDVISDGNYLENKLEPFHKT